MQLLVCDQRFNRDIRIAVSPLSNRGAFLLQLKLRFNRPDRLKGLIVDRNQHLFCLYKDKNLLFSVHHEFSIRPMNLPT